MTRAPILFVAAILFGIAAPAARADDGPSTQPHLEIELVSEAKAIRPGSRSTLGLRFKIEPKWHVYWKNPGDSGDSPKVTWTLPRGASAGPIQWPAPVRLHVGPLAAFAYVDEFVLPVRVTWPDALPAGPVEIRAHVDWLVCQEECTPGDADLSLRLPAAEGDPEPDPRWAPLFAGARALLPRPLPPGAASMARGASGYALTVAKGGPWDAPAAAVEFFPEDDVLANAARQPVTRGPEGTTLALAPSARAQAKPSALRGVLVVGAEPSRVAFAVDTSSVPVRRNTDDDMSVWSAVFLALLGGVLLNLMPCVLPVLSIKVLGFVERAGEDPKRARRHGWVYGWGVLAAFWAFAAIVLAIRGSGERVGWGFQLQEPIVVAGTVLLFHLMGLNLFGVFEVGTGLSGLADRGAREGYAGSFWSGALATVVATPCTGPFMAIALVKALEGTTVETIAILSALGIGMAAPYVLLATFPRALAKVPRPGPWMNTLKRALAFPLFATAVWFGGVFGEQMGSGGLLHLLWAALVATLAAWTYGHWGSASRSTPVRWIAGRALPVALLVATGLLAWRASHPPPPAVDPWEPYRAERIAEGVAEGRPVFVDFTAAWCISCKANEAAALSSDAFFAAVKKYDVLLLKADWTSKDPAVTAALKSLHRASVPVYVVYSPVPGRAPEILPQVLTPGMVVDALSAAAPPATGGLPAGP